ncbi:hypothetical protein HanPSC8_Chr12g0541161 [Helianthus annuus]|nr:hypothetical protein HanPSC8_Chr12g0541161 [Helianthus annuus]
MFDRFSGRIGSDDSLIFLCSEILLASIRCFVVKNKPFFYYKTPIKGSSWVIVTNTTQQR